MHFGRSLKHNVGHFFHTFADFVDDGYGVSQVHLSSVLGRFLEDRHPVRFRSNCRYPLDWISLRMILKENSVAIYNRLCYAFS